VGNWEWGVGNGEWGVWSGELIMTVDIVKKLTLRKTNFVKTKQT
jgi:hypothetical protein